MRATDLAVELLDVFDWPVVTGGLQKGLYASDEPIPVGVSDLATLARSHPRGKVPTRLNWERLTAEDFERLIFMLISAAPGYESPQWLVQMGDKPLRVAIAETLNSRQIRYQLSVTNLGNECVLAAGEEMVLARIVVVRSYRRTRRK